MSWICSPDRVRGIDVSGWQSDVDWLTLTGDESVAFAYVKGGEGTSRTKSAKIHMAGAADAGLLTGLYFFGRPDTHSDMGFADATSEAKASAKTWREMDALHGVAMGPILDVERGRWKGKDQKPNSSTRHKYNAGWVLEWLETAHEETGRLPWIYTARWAFNAYLKRAPADAVKALTRFPLILADYDGNPEDEVAPWPFWCVWQDSGSATMAGVPGKVDTNWMRQDVYLSLLRGSFDTEYREQVP